MNPLLSNKQKPCIMEVNKLDSVAHNTARQVEVIEGFHGQHTSFSV